MAIEAPNDETAPHNPHGLEEGVALVLKAKESGDWKAVADWLAHNPDHAHTLAVFMANEDWVEEAVASARVAQPDLAGSMLGGLELREQIGKGGMGVVYRAFDSTLKRDVAVKRIRTGRELSAVELAKFREEAETVAAMDHPNIVRVLSFGEERGEPYLVMPLLEGSMADWLEELGPDRCRPADEAAKLVRDIALGVHHAHQHGVIHRDLKPGNILLDTSRTPHIADFGLARHADVTATAPPAGTPAYMAPEQARGEKHLSTAVDVHALGIILFELLTGSRPFAGANGPSIMRKITDESAPLLRQFCPGVSLDLEAVCLKCLEKLPKDRYGSAQEVADDLGRFLRREAVTARQPGFWDWVRQLARTRPEVNANYSWQVLVWFGGIVLAANAVVYGLVRGEAGSAWVWVTHIASGAGMCAVLWWYMLSRFRELPVTERHSLVLAVGHILAFFPLMVAYVPLSFLVPAREGMGFYPALAAVSAVCLFTLGSTNWSRFFLIGSAFMAEVPLLARGRKYPRSSTGLPTLP